jgi:transcriptional regulator with XRE-family HTH domain
VNAVDYRRSLAALGLSQTRAAKLLGINPRTSRRWALGEQDIAEPAARLLMALEHFDIDPAEAYKLFMGPRQTAAAANAPPLTYKSTPTRPSSRQKP